LHILCHGDLDRAAGEGVLIFEDIDGDAEPVNAELLRLQLQKQYGQTRLVLLNACMGALPGGDDPFSSVGAALLRSGVPAVIAMQFELAEDAAAELARIFYTELVAGAPVDLALTEARLHLYGRYATRLDWAIPVLFLRSEDGILFEAIGKEALSPPPPRPPNNLPTIDRDALKRLWQQALTAFFTKDWERAEVLLAQVAADDPN
jgi:CHAT domain-containing protein